MSQQKLEWSTTQLYFRGDDFFSDLITDIRRAQTRVLLEYYIFEVDPLTLIILSELEQAQKRGCQIHLLVDGFGSYFWVNELEKICKEKKISFQVFHPLPMAYKHYRRIFFIPLVKLYRGFRRLNHRTHRKLTLIDDEVAYLGSMNMTQVHSEKRMGESSWKDIGLRLTGGSLADLTSTFWLAWSRARRSLIQSRLRGRKRDLNYHPYRSLVRLNTNTWLRFILYRDLLKKVKSSQHRIWIEMAYFLPRRAIFKALKKAAARGVSVQIILPSRSDVPIVKWAAEGLIMALLKSNVEVYEFLPRMLHSKLVMIDDWAVVGSHNWNHRSFIHDLEVEAILTDSNSLQTLSQSWAETRQHSRKVSLSEPRWKNPFRRWLGQLAFRLRYLL